MVSNSSGVAGPDLPLRSSFVRSLDSTGAAQETKTILDGRTRWILRRSIQDLLPEEVQWPRGKSDLSHAGKDCLFKQRRGNPSEADAATSKQLIAHVCSKNLIKLRRCFRAHLEDQATLFHWQVANLMLWLERSGLTA